MQTNIKTYKGLTMKLCTRMYIVRLTNETKSQEADPNNMGMYHVIKVLPQISNGLFKKK